MALPSSGPISLSAINSERGVAAGSTVSLGDSGVRSLLGVGSGAISLANAYGKSSAPAWTVGFSTTDGQDSGLVTDGMAIYSAQVNSTAVYLTSNPAAVWGIALSYGQTGNYSSSPQDGQGAKAASFSSYISSGGGYYGNQQTQEASWQVSASYNGQTISFTVTCSAFGNTDGGPLT